MPIPIDADAVTISTGLPDLAWRSCGDGAQVAMLGGDDDHQDHVIVDV